MFFSFKKKKISILIDIIPIYEKAFSDLFLNKENDWVFKNFDWHLVHYPQSLESYLYKKLFLFDFSNFFEDQKSPFYKLQSSLHQFIHAPISKQQIHEIHSICSQLLSNDPFFILKKIQIQLN